MIFIFHQRRSAFLANIFLTKKYNYLRLYFYISTFLHLNIFFFLLYIEIQREKHYNNYKNSKIKIKYTVIVYTVYGCNGSEWLRVVKFSVLICQTWTFYRRRGNTNRQFYITITSLDYIWLEIDVDECIECRRGETRDSRRGTRL